jgi:hypothetical protein
VNDDFIPATTHRKAGLDQEGPSPHEGEQTYLAGSGVHAQDLVPNPVASGLIAYFDVIFAISELVVLCLCPLYFFWRSLQVFNGEDRISRSSDYFSELASSGLILPCICCFSILHFF